MLHFKCRNAVYPLSNIQRLFTNDNQINWHTSFPEYHPPFYEAPGLKNKEWADPGVSDPNFKPIWNQLDGNINRSSHIGIYEIIDLRPRNPIGRTGLEGRGRLGRWGPNHAADPIVTRWKLNNGCNIFHHKTKLPILQFCAIQRKDCDEWAIPGGMVDPGENISKTLMREFVEEALNSSDKIDERKLSEFFNCGKEVYKGYVDDPRNTDNAWMETLAVNFHDENGDIMEKFVLNAGDDAKNVRWMDMDSDMRLYASHSHFLHQVANIRKAHW